MSTFTSAWVKLGSGVVALRFQIVLGGRLENDPPARLAWIIGVDADDGLPVEIPIGESDVDRLLRLGALDAGNAAAGWLERLATLASLSGQR